jgi:coat protein Gp5
VANDFSKEEIVLFDQVLDGFNDACIATKMAKVFMTNQQTMERTGDQIWRPEPYIMTSYSGNDMTSNFKDVTQLSVPVSINVQRAVPFQLTARELRDQQQEGRLGRSAKDKLASDINVSLTNTAAAFGSIVIKRTVAATGFDDIALCDATMTELGVPMDGRVYGASPRDYNNMAANLASRTLDNSKSLKAYERAFLGDVAGFNTWKLNYASRLAAKTAVTVSIQNTGDLAYIPVSHTVDDSGVSINKDNRYMNIAVTVTSGTIAVGDCFTINAVNAVHHITKVSTGQPKTFRVTAIVSGAGGSGVITITPPIIAPNNSYPSTLQYQNVDAAAVDDAAITFLNTVAAYVNPFWYGDAMEIIPGRLMPAQDSGMAVMRGTTDDGIELTMTRQGSILDLSTKYRFDTIYGTSCLNPELAGIEIFSQT